MVTEISPIFGLSLLGILEILTLIVGFGSFCVAFVIWRTHCHQKKIASANLVYKYKGAWRVDVKFTDFLVKIKDPKAKVDPKKDPVYSTLDHFEDIAILWNQDVLDFNQVKEFFGTSLDDINNNKSIMACLHDLNKTSENQYYTNLIELLKKIDW